MLEALESLDSKVNIKHITPSKISLVVLLEHEAKESERISNIKTGKKCRKQEDWKILRIINKLLKLTHVLFDGGQCKMKLFLYLLFSI